MIIPAYQEQQGLQFRQIDQLHPYDQSSKVKGRFAGIVLKVIRDEKMASFTVSDGTATAEVTLVYKKLSQSLELPVKGDSVQIVGDGYKKMLGGTKNPFSFLKIFATCISRITPQQELQMCITAALSRQKRVKQQTKVEAIQKLQPLSQLRTFQSPQEKLSLKTLVMIYCYYVFEHNTDIQSYIFNEQMIRSSKDGNQFLNDARVSKSCLDTAIKKTLMDISSAGFLTEKHIMQNNKKETFFVMKRDLLSGIQRVFQEKIKSMNQKGVGIEHLTAFVNGELCKYSNCNFTLFDLKFSQKVLIKMQNQSKIYKTSDKLIFPNIRF